MSTKQNPRRERTEKLRGAAEAANARLLEKGRGALEVVAVDASLIVRKKQSAQ